MKKVLLIAALAACVSATNMPILAKVLGFSATAAYAGVGGGDDQGEDNDNQGDDNSQ